MNKKQLFLTFLILICFQCKNLFGLFYFPKTDDDDPSAFSLYYNEGYKYSFLDIDDFILVCAQTSGSGKYIREMRLEEENAFKESCQYINKTTSNLNFEEKDLERWHFEKSTLHNPNFKNAILKNAFCMETTFDEAYAVGVNCEGTNFTKAKIINSNFSNSSFKNGVFTSVTFENVNLENTDFTNALMLNVTFKNVEVKDANFKNTTCLTNDQKEFLRLSGAVNVPPNLTENELKKEIKRATKKCSCFKWLCCGPCCLTYKVFRKIKKCWCGKVKDKKN